MDSITYVVFLLAVKMVTSIGDVIEYDDGSVAMIYQKAKLKKNTDSLLIKDQASAALIKDSDSLFMGHVKSFLEKDFVEGLTKIGDGYASYVTKKSDGTVRTRIQESQLIKYEKDVDIYHGNLIQLRRNSDIFLITDGSLGLEKNSNGFVKLYDGKSVAIRKYADGYVGIVEGKSVLGKDTDGNVEIYDGISASIEKKMDGSLKIRNSKSFIKKHPSGSVSVADDYTLLANDADGYVNVRDREVFINEDEHGNRIIRDNGWSIVKDSSRNSSVNKDVATIVNDQEGIKVTIRYKPNESKDLIMQIKDHVLQVNSRSKFFSSFNVKLFNRIKEDNVRICFSSNGTVNVLVHRKKGTIACPQGTTRTESLKTLQSSQ